MKFTYILKDNVISVRKILPASKLAHAKMVALVQEKTAQISTNAKQTHTTVR